MTMFDRCDADTMRVVDSAIDDARGIGHDYVGTEHLLLALARHRDVLPPPVGSMLPDMDALRSAIASILGAPSRRDAEVLSAAGIDLDSVRSAVRHAGAFECFVPPECHRPDFPEGNTRSAANTRTDR